MKKRAGFGLIVFIIFLIIAFFNQIVGLSINIQWFKEVGYLSVFFTRLKATLILMIPIFLISFIGIWFYYKSIKKSIIKVKKVVEVDNRRNSIENKIFIIINVLFSFFISYSFSSNYWYRILQFVNASDFNVKDPIFNKDVSFFIFKLPLIESLQNVFMTLLIFLVIITVVTYLIMSAKDKIYNFSMRDSLTNVKNISGLTSFAGKQLAVVSSLILILLSLGYIIKAWNLVYSPRGVVFGASYTDMHVSLIFYKIIAVVSVIAAAVILFSILKNKTKPIIISIALIFVLVIGEGIISSVVQQFIVKSNEKSFEEKYINYNIEYTRKAFNIDNIEENDFEVKNNLTQESIKNNKATIDNIKINSFKPALEFYNQVQVIRYYYNFNDIDVDRYTLNGKYNQVFIAPREIDLSSLEGNASTWQNMHLIYTHGYGIVMSKVNSVTSEGQPDFVIKDIPPENSTDIKLENPRIYFGENTNDYAVVNTDIPEFDYPKGGDNQTNKYDGTAGLNMNLLNKIMFAVNKGSMKFLLSQDINSESKILINRNVKDRIQKIAPFLYYDNDPYLVVNNGRLYWIVDAYTVSDRYPFSQPVNGINYIRNSVKVVVDAFNGTVDYYIVDKNDPIIMSYSKIFPGLFKDGDTIDETFMEHYRYPEDIFNIQCSVLGKYHVTNAGVFYNGEDLWEVAKNQKSVEGEKDINEAAYVVMNLPNEEKEEMVLLEYFNMRNRDNMVALFGARMDKGNYGKMILYKFPPQRTIYSPYLFKQKLNQDTTISKELSLWNKEGSSVQFGDTIIVPIDDSLLYVEPLYLRAQGKNSIPEMKRVIVSYGDKIILAENIESALQQLFNIKDTGDSNISKPIDPGTISGDDATISKAKELYNSAIEAQKNGDWAKYGEYITELGKILEQLQ